MPSTGWLLQWHFNGIVWLLFEERGGIRKRLVHNLWGSIRYLDWSMWPCLLQDKPYPRLKRSRLWIRCLVICFMDWTQEWSDLEAVCWLEISLLQSLKGISKNVWGLVEGKNQPFKKWLIQASICWSWRQLVVLNCFYGRSISWCPVHIYAIR